MKNFNPIDVIESKEPYELEEIILELNDTGILFNEDEPSFMSDMLMKNWTTECEEYLRDRGYDGGILLPIGKFISGTGNLYALINTEEEGALESARNHLEVLANRNS